MGQEVTLTIRGKADTAEIEKLKAEFEKLAPTFQVAADSVKGAAAEAAEAVKGVGDTTDGVSEKIVGLSAKARDAIGGLGKAAAVGGVAFAGLAVGAGAALLAVGNEFDGAYDAIQVATGATGAKLDEFKGTLKNVVSDVPGDFGAAADVIGAFGQRLDIVGDVEALSKQVLNLSNVTGVDAVTAANTATDTFAKFGIAGKDQAAALDVLFVASQKSGVGFAELQAAVSDNAAILKSAGLGYNESAGLIAELGAAGIDAAEVIPSMGKAIAAAAKEGKSGQDALQEFVDRIKDAGSESEAQTVAVEAFGKGGLKMAAAIRTGALDVGMLVTGLDEAGGAINDTAASTADFGERMGLLKNRVMVALEPLGAIALDTMNKVVDALAPVAEDLMAAFADPKVKAALESLQATIVTAVDMLVEKFGQIDWGAVVEKVQSMGETIGGIFTWLSENPTVAKIIGVIAGLAAAFGVVMVVVGPFIPIIMAVVGAIGGLLPILATVAAVLTGPLAIAIGIAIGLFLLWRAKGDEIMAALSAVAEVIGQKFTQLKAELSQVWEDIKAAFTAAGEFIASKADLIKAVLLTILTGGLILVYAGWVKYGDDIKAKTAEIIASIKQKWEDLKAATVAKWNEIKAAVWANIVAVGNKVLEILASIKAAWDAAWSGLAALADTAWNNMIATITTVLGIIRGLVDTGMNAVRDVFALGWSTLSLLVDAAWTTIKAAVQIGIDYVRSVVTAGMQLLSGDWRGAWATLHEAANTAIGRVKALVGALASWLGTLKDSVLQRAGDIGRAIGDGIKNALDTGWKLVLDKLRALVDLLPQVVKDMLGIASPSKVFEQLGEWILIGLASGIQKADQKAIEALANVVGKMGAVASGLADFGKKLVDMVVPTDAQIAAAKEKYIRMTLILTDFIKSVSYLGALLPVANVSKAEPGQIKAINAGLTQLSQAFPAIKELQGMTANNLLTGGEASWAGMLADTVGKIAQVWGGLADNMTKMASAKFPSDSQMDALKAATIRIAVWAQGILDQPEGLSAVGAEEFARAMKGMADALTTVGGLNLAGIVAVADTQLQTASESIGRLSVWARNMVTGWLAEAGTPEERAAFLVNLTEFSGMVKAAADALKAGDIGDLSKVVTVQWPELQALKDNLGRMQQAAGELVQVWIKGAGDAAARAQWITDLKDFAATMGAAADILKIAAIGEIKAGLTYTVETVKAVLIEVRDVLTPALEEIVGAWSLGADAAKRSTESMQEFAGWIGAALALAKLSEVGTLKGEIEADVIEIRAVLNWVRVHLAPAMQLVADAWVRTTEEAERATKSMGEFAGWIGAAIGLAKAADIGTLSGDIEADVIELRAVLNWVRNNLAPEMQKVADAWGVATKTAGEMTARMKDFADWIGAALGMAKLANVGTLAGEIEADVIELRAVLNWVRLHLAPEMQAVADAWGQTAESAKPMIERMQAFAAYIAAAVGLAKAADIGSLAAVTSPADMGAKLDIVKANVTAVFKMLGEIALTITTEEANAGALLATALGTGMKGLGDFAGGIGSLMDLAESKLFGSNVNDPNGGPLSFGQRTRGRRADFFATQLRDTVIRAVKAMQAALSGITISVGDPKTMAIAELGDAFGKLADALKALAETKLPDATRLAALVAALNGGAGLGLAGAGAGGGNVRIGTVTADTATVNAITFRSLNMNATIAIDGREIARGVTAAMISDVQILDDLGKALAERAARRP